MFHSQTYEFVIRPDVERLHSYPTEPTFQNDKFWGPATDLAGQTIPHADKMKWHELGPGRVQLRLGVVLLNGVAHLCRAYVKDGPQRDEREVARLKHYVSMIQQGRWTYRGIP